MADVKKGGDLVAVAIANTFQSYLPTEIANVNGAWNDAATVPALPNPKKYFSERRLEVPESPCLMVGMLNLTRTATWGSSRSPSPVHSLVFGHSANSTC